MATPTETAYSKLEKTRAKLESVRIKARAELGVWMAMRGQNYVMLPDHTPFNDWRASNKLSPLDTVDLMNGGTIRRKKCTLKLEPVDGAAFITADEYSVALDVIEWTTWYPHGDTDD